MTLEWPLLMPAWGCLRTVGPLGCCRGWSVNSLLAVFFFQNEVWTAQKAHELGAIDLLVDEASLLDTAISMANDWSSWGSHTKEATKHLLHVQADNDFGTHLDHERTLIEAAGTTEAFKEGVDAFLNKRSPEFK